MEAEPKTQEVASLGEALAEACTKAIQALMENNPEEEPCVEASAGFLWLDAEDVTPRRGIKISVLAAFESRGKKEEPSSIIIP